MSRSANSSIYQSQVSKEGGIKLANKNESPRIIENCFWIIWRSRWSFLAILLVCLIVAVIINVVSPIVYEASSTIAIVQSNGANKMSYDEEIAKMNIPILQNHLLIKNVAKKLKGGEATEGEIRDIQKNLRIKMDKKTNTIKVAVRDKSPEGAAAVSNAIVEQAIISRRDKQQKLGNIIRINEAIKPDKPIAPQKLRNIIFGFAIGLALGLMFAFLRDYFDKTYPTLEDAKRDLESLPTPITFLGVIPAMEKAEGERIALKTYDAPNTGPSEAFRIIRTKLRFIDTDSPLRTMLITSSTQAEGKTTIASNLAVSLAQMDKRILILDADMRRPTLHKIFPLDDSGKTVSASSDSRKPGLSELLIMVNEKDPKAALSEIVRKTEVENLLFIPCGTIPPNPSELLDSESMRKLIPLLEEEYDYVVIDSPPVRVVSDPVILASMVDCVICVFNIVKTKKDDIRFGLEELMVATPREIGIVCNLID